MRILVSACLAGDVCRWHGRKVSVPKAVRESMGNGDEVLRVCPEELAGLGTPRKPVKRRSGRVYETCADKQKRPQVTGADVTEAFHRGARKAFTKAKKFNPDKCILCRWSPSCDKTGIFGRMLVEQGYEVINI